jgi:hypothetical protein
MHGGLFLRPRSGKRALKTSVQFSSIFRMILSKRSSYSDELFSPMPLFRLPAVLRVVVPLVTLALGSVAMAASSDARPASLTTLKVEPLSAAPAVKTSELVIGEQKFAADGTLGAAKLAGLPDSARPIAGTMQSNAGWVITVDQAGARQLWRYEAASGWTQRAAPPLTPLPGAVRASGQAHLLVLASGEDGGMEMLSYQTITNAWARLGAVAVTGAVLDVRLHDNGFALRTTESAGYTAVTI